MAVTGNATAGIHIQGLRTTQRKVKELPEDARKELRSASNQIAVKVGDEARGRFTALGRQGPLVGGTLRAVTGDVPTIRVGGTRKLGHNRKPAFKLLYGTEFGSNKYRQFHARHTGRTGRALWPTIRKRQAYMIKRWMKAADKAIKKFGEG